MNATRKPLPARKDFLAFGRPNFSQAEIDAVTRTMRSGWIGMGPETIAFERELGAFTGAPHVVTVNSCTSALHLSLVVLGIGPGDEVICPSLTWCSTANAALYVGARPVLCDVDPETLSVTPGTILRCVTPRTRAVMVVHMGGLAMDVAALRRALPPHVAVVEDAAHALGARYPSGAPVGSSGNLTCFSFYANKNLATGEGGAIALADPAKAEQLRSLRQHGLSSDAWKRYIAPTKMVIPGVDRLGYKMNFTDLQACIGRVQLQRQPEFREIRLALAKRYGDLITRAGIDVTFQKGVLDDWHARHLFVVRLPVGKMQVSRNELLLRMRERNIGASVHYPPLHRMGFYQPFATGVPNTEALADEILTLPIGASMTQEDVDQVVGHLDELIRASA